MAGRDGGRNRVLWRLDVLGRGQPSDGCLVCKPHGRSVMSLKVRLSVAIVAAAALSAAGLLLLTQSGASARTKLNYAHLTKFQKRIVSQTLASSLGPQSKARRSSQHRRRRGWRPRRCAVHPAIVVRIAQRHRVPGHLLPHSAGTVLADPGRQREGQPELPERRRSGAAGRGQAQNETAIAVDPNNPNHMLASQNDYTARRRQLLRRLLARRRPPLERHDDADVVHLRRRIRQCPASTGRPAATPPSRGTPRATPTSAARCSTAARRLEQSRPVERVLRLPLHRQQRRFVELPRSPGRGVRRPRGRRNDAPRTRTT